MRNKIIAGNWKMNKTRDEAIQLAHELKHKFQKKNNVATIIFPPFLYIHELTTILSNSGIEIGAQNCSQFETGAYTGEISASMLKSSGANYVIIGHSERRNYFSENNLALAHKTKLVLKNNLIPVFCIGETLEERNLNKHKNIIKLQLLEGLFHLTSSEFKNTVIAYEPVWAIGTGITATPEQAQEMHLFIRTLINEKYGNEISEEITILYGGSCNAQNAASLFSCKDIDGGLIGGASLIASDFISIFNAL